MTTNGRNTITHFLKRQVFRNDYLIVNEWRPRKSQLPYELKLEQLHFLCVSQHYRAAADCEAIRQTLYAQPIDEVTPPAILLTQAYLPQCITHYFTYPNNVDDSQEHPLAGQAVENQLPRVITYRSSWIEWNRLWYRLRLPEDVHSVLIELDSALLAA